MQKHTILVFTLLVALTACESCPITESMGRMDVDALLRFYPNLAEEIRNGRFSLNGEGRNANNGLSSAKDTPDELINKNYGSTTTPGPLMDHSNSSSGDSYQNRPAFDINSFLDAWNRYMASHEAQTEKHD